jgi:uncharacterized phage protein (TIGR01671 family)
MIDRFKFRAWHLPTAEMFDVYGFNDIYTFGKNISNKRAELNQAKSRDCILEQCTSLKDTNGSSIYEGDIVNSGYNYYIVMWNGENAAYHLQIKGGDKTFLPLNQTNINKLNLVIAGNIHQNPELLKS